MSVFLKNFQGRIAPMAAMLAICFMPHTAHTVQANDLYHQASFAPGAQFFDYEKEYSHRGKLVQWEELTSKLQDETSRFAGQCSQYGEFCLPKSWDEHIEKMRAMPIQKKLDYANRLINQYHYATDRKIYGTTDYWATPLEIATQGKGDCEDHAISKFAILLAAGVPEKSMRILILNNTREHYKHAILTVATSSGVMYLDDQKAQVKSADNVPYYQPIYSLNFDAWWLHERNMAGL
jgi:predicted transglutaminase-like cysteine proteinase